MLGPVCEITVGSWFVTAPCIFNSVKIDTQPTEYSWDTAIPSEPADQNDHYFLPVVVDVSADGILLTGHNEESRLVRNSVMIAAPKIDYGIDVYTVDKFIKFVPPDPTVGQNDPDERVPETEKSLQQQAEDRFAAQLAQGLSDYEIAESLQNNPFVAVEQVDAGPLGYVAADTDPAQQPSVQPLVLNVDPNAPSLNPLS